MTNNSDPDTTSNSESEQIVSRSQNLVEMTNISKSFGGLRALQKVDITVPTGAVVAIVGDNAAGKSTLMKILTGAYQSDSGNISFEGETVSIRTPGDSKKLGIEMIYQDLALCPNRNVTTNIFLGREKTRLNLGILRVLDWTGMKAEARTILETLQIQIGSLESPLRKLSGGQRQAVAIGRAVSFSPKLVIMDEPTASLAIKEVDAVLDLIRQLQQSGISVILISHRLEDVFAVSDWIFVLRAGRMVRKFVTREVVPDEVIRHMFLGHASDGYDDE